MSIKNWADLWKVEKIGARVSQPAAPTMVSDYIGIGSVRLPLQGAAGRGLHRTEAE